jgi:hypothetical protein
MTNIYTFLSVSSVAAVLMAGTVQAQSLPPEGPVSVSLQNVSTNEEVNRFDLLEYQVFCDPFNPKTPWCCDPDSCP